MAELAAQRRLLHGGGLLWLDVDTRIRELTGERRSLDDFARTFFGMDDGVWVTNTYTFEDVVATLQSIASFDWGAFFDEKLHQTTAGAPPAGLKRGGYGLVYRDHPSDYQQSKEAVLGLNNLLFSIGLMLTPEGEIKEVLWEGPAFRAGVTAGSQILSVNGRAYDAEELQSAITAGARGEPIELTLKVGKRTREVSIACPGGHRYPHLEPISGARTRLDEILTPLQ